MADTKKHGDARAETYEALDDIPVNPMVSDAFGDIVMRRFGRREMLQGGLGVAAATVLFGTAALTTCSGKDEVFEFDEISGGIDVTHHVADGYEAQILLRWGDPIFEDSPAFDPEVQSVETQLKQFGFNNDYIGYFSLDGADDRALLCVNHEYTIEEVMFPGLARQDKIAFRDMTHELTDIEMAAHGVTVVEIALEKGKWKPVLSSRYNRRISTYDTVMSVDGPAAGHARLKTKADPSGKKIIGTVNNCAGGVTPWGTYLTAEENFHKYFWGEGNKGWRNQRYGVPAKNYGWGKFYDRFDIDKEPNEPNRFGWIVEIDPFDPTSVPVKHTMLGRLSHEGAECILNKDGRAVVYCGDDGRFEYIFRFVSANKFDPKNRAANMKLLSEGTLSVAKFHEDGRLEWLDLIYGKEPLIPHKGFYSQADVLIDARIAADLLGGTPMDRPEDVQPNEKNGKVYAMLTNNNKRKPGSENVANPRPENLFGHIVEMTPPGGDHSAPIFDWTILLQCGDPAISDVGSVWHPETTKDGWFACPDNCAIDADGRLWVATDQGSATKKTKKADGLYAVETEGAGRGKSKLFFRCPEGAEMCGPHFSPNGENLFLAVQHPGGSWPDFKADMPARPSVVAVRRKGGGKIA